MSVASSADGSESLEAASLTPTSTYVADCSIKLRTTLGHQGYTLIAIGFIVFELGFLTLYSNDFWFEVNVAWLGVPVALLALCVTHVFLTWVESESGCNFFSPVWKRRPPCVYRQWLRLNDTDLEPGLSFGQRHVVWRAIDEVELTFWGNLRILSRALSGAPSTREKKSKIALFRPVDSEEILKVPFGFASAADQKLLIDAMRCHNPALKLNERLTKRLSQPDVKGTTYVQQIGAVFLFLVLMDVGFSMFSYLEMLKNYYLCEFTAVGDSRIERKLAPHFFEQAEEIRGHPLPFSWVSTKILREGKVASGLYQTRAEALWALGKKDEAIESMQKSLKLSPSFRLNLKLARMMALNGQSKKAEEQLKMAMEEHDSALLPRLYMLALKTDSERPNLYKGYLHDLDDDLFGTDLLWPPGSHVFLQDVFYRDDLTFIFDKLLNTDTSGIRGKEVVPKSVRKSAKHKEK
ncbi:MAG TPA: tetratricopeptide repeat protein [Drouetiella sp.]|jgi:tetratricopeptide (TPR) repeat protein